MKYSGTYTQSSRDEIVSAVQKKVKPKRFEHILRVEETAIKLAKKNGVDVEAASIAALLHDYAKDTPLATVQSLFDEGRLDAAMIAYGSEVWHGPVASIWAKDEFGINDERIIEAIKEHTIGGVDMTDLSKVLFIADYIEPGRNFPGVEEARKLAKKSVEVASFYKIKQTLLHLVEKEKQIYPQTLSVYNAWVKKMEEPE